MGREIRRVPPNWEHPKKEDGGYIPLHEQTYKEACQQWRENFFKWEKTERAEWLKEEGENVEYWDVEGGPPSDDCYLPEFTEEATWFQVYETVSEGTPVSPPFESAEELAIYLSENGDFWFQNHPAGFRTKPTLDQARKFVNVGWGPSMLMANGKQFDAYQASSINDNKKEEKK